MKKFFVFFLLMCPLRVFAEGMPASLPVNQSIFQPETTRPLYNIEKNSYTNSAIQQMSSSKDEVDIKNNQQPAEPKEKGLKGLFDGFTVEW